MTATIPHQLGKAEAKRRIQSQLAGLRGQYGSLFTNVSETWTGDTLAFSLSAMGETISGRLTVDDQALYLTVSLPWILQMLETVIRPQIEEQGRKLLDTTSAV
jgi:hypothetical protein